MFADEEDGAGSAAPGLRSARLVRRGRLSGLFAGNVRAACLFGPEFFGEGSSGGGSKSGICVRSASPKTVFASSGTVLPPILRRQNVRERFLSRGSFAPPMYLGSVRCERFPSDVLPKAVRSRRSRFLLAAGLFRRLPERNLFEAGVGSSGASGVSWGARRSRFGMKPGTVLSFAGLCGGRTANASDAVSMGKSGTAGRKMAAVKRRGVYARGPCRRT